MRIDVQVDISGALRQIDLAQKQARFATAVALTRTAKAVEAELQRELRSKIDRPTPYTLRSTFTTPATRERLSATVWFKDRPGSKARRSSADILGHLFSGGTRQHKALEGWLRAAGYISAGEFVAPGEAARLDQYGNISRGQVSQILSQLRAGPDRSAYASSSTRSKRNRKRAGEMFWSRGGHLPRGVWMRFGFAVGSAVKPILIVVGRPQYQRMFDIEQIGRRVARAMFDAEFRKALRAALATARR